MSKPELHLSKEMRRRTAEKRRRKRSLGIRFAIVLVALAVLLAWILLFMS